ncbi:Pentatricopeptide repeat-containing protein [Vigna angularis]|uniref:Pentatricopeptide repeat-containing protein n=1 Tax=Phaseolus angularis TaxID=3914 RepID=A0A8T0JU29_PHAAN|nr:Pentatricopeptide repeat-containing protein [Vigna angularis]
MAASSLSHPQTCHASHPRNPNPTTNQNRHRTPSRSATGSDLDAIFLRHRSRSCSATGRDLDAISQRHRTQSGHDLAPPPDAIWLRHGRDLSPRRTGAASLLSSPPPKLDKFVPPHLWPGLVPQEETHLGRVLSLSIVLGLIVVDGSPSLYGVIHERLLGMYICTGHGIEAEKQLREMKLWR